MSSTATSVARFFETYQRALDQDDPAATLPLYADNFLAAGPQGAKCVPAAVFGPAVASRKQLFDRLGCRPPELASVTPIPLDTRYVLVRTEWRFVFDPPRRQSETIQVESSYLLDTASDPFRILLYLAHNDILAILRDRGLLDVEQKPLS